MLAFLGELIAHYYTLIIVVFGTSIIGAVAGGVGVFALLRRQSLLGDAISHAALPGIALMFLYTRSTNPFVLIFGGGIAGCIGALLMAVILHTTNLKRDALLGIILSVFFGFGIVLKTVIQKHAYVHQAVLGKFFFGNASTLLPIDVFILLCIAIVIAFLLWCFWKEFKVLAFDTEFAQAAGYPVLLLDIFLTFLIVVAIVIGLHAVGVLLMSAMLIAPAAAARQWTTRVGTMFVLAVLFGSGSGMLGSLLSSMVNHLPTGPTIVVIVSSIVTFSLLFAPGRGVMRRGHE